MSTNEKCEEIVDIELDAATWATVDEEAKKLGITPEAFVTKCLLAYADKLSAPPCEAKASVRYPTHN